MSSLALALRMCNEGAEIGDAPALQDECGAQMPCSQLLCQLKRRRLCRANRPTSIGFMLRQWRAANGL